MKESPSQLGPERISLSVAFDMVSLIVHCNSNYEAQVLYDDLESRLASMAPGETLTLTITGGIYKPASKR